MATANDLSVYAKTPKGIAEVAHRGGALTLAARRVLIVIDGRRSLGELAQLLRSNGIDEVVQLLEAQGYVARQGEAPAPRTLGAHTRHGEHEPIEVNTVTDTGREPDERPLLTVDEAKRRALRELQDRLGAEAEVMAVRLEQARTPDDLRERLREAERLVAGLLGEAAATDYLRALRRR